MSVKYNISDEQIERARQANASTLYRPPFPGMPEYNRRRNLGFYRNFNDIDDASDSSCLLPRKLAAFVSPSVVGLSCRRFSDGLQQRCSGIVVEYNMEKKILTSTYILGGHSNVIGLKVEILFANGMIKEGEVSFFDEEHNVAIIHGDLGSTKAAPLDPSLCPLSFDVISLGRNSKFGLMVSRGKLNIRNDVLESDDLMSSSSIISESGIGGPLIDISRGCVIGMNVYIQKKSTLFMPYIILRHCFEQLLDYGKVRRPCIGLNTRSINEKTLKDLEVIYDKFPFPFIDGITVNKVIAGSPADEVGMSVGDIITRCNSISVTSPVELADMVFEMGMSHCGVVTREAKKRAKTTIEVVIQKLSSGATEVQTISDKGFTPPVSSSICRSWLAFPVETRDVETGMNVLC